jgi:soluble lytic murein transglycosylase-like protein
MFRVIIILVLSLLITGAQDWDKCFGKASRAYGIDERILRSIAKVESNNNPYAVNIRGHSKAYGSADDALNALFTMDKSGSFDLGVMQINSRWFRLYKINFEMGFSPCYNIYFGAYVLASELYASGGDINIAVGRYHSQDPQRQVTYRNKIIAEFKKLTQ